MYLLPFAPKGPIYITIILCLAHNSMWNIRNISSAFFFFFPFSTQVTYRTAVYFWKRRITKEAQNDYIASVYLNYSYPGDVSQVFFELNTWNWKEYKFSKAGDIFIKQRWYATVWSLFFACIDFLYFFNFFSLSCSVRQARNETVFQELIFVFFSHCPFAVLFCT